MIFGFAVVYNGKTIAGVSLKNKNIGRFQLSLLTY